MAEYDLKEDSGFMIGQLKERSMELKELYREFARRSDRYAVKNRSELMQQLNLSLLIEELLQGAQVLSPNAGRAFERLVEPRRLKTRRGNAV